MGICNSVLFSGLTALAFGAALAASSPASAQDAADSPASAQDEADPNAAAIAALQTYQLPDQTGSARLPTDWNVVQTGVGYIQAHGPRGEFALFGVTIPAQDAASSGNSATGLTEPYSDDPTEKFLASINWMRAQNHKPAVQAQFYGSSPVSAPPGFGSCTNILAVFNGALATETVFCSLPLDKSGNYRNFFKAVGLPVRHAKQQRTLLEAILASFRLNIQAIKDRHGSGWSAAGQSGSVSSTVSAQNSIVANALMMQEANQINQETFQGMAGSDASVNNFDHGVLRGQTPIYRQGMQQPVFWVGN